MRRFQLFDALKVKFTQCKNGQFTLNFEVLIFALEKQVVELQYG